MNLSDLDVHRALVVGDMHGNLSSWEYTIAPAARRRGADIIVQVGDFGYGWEDWYLAELDAVLREQIANPLVVWLDGNHENFDALELAGAFPDKTAPVQTSEYSWYLPRGYAWGWGGARFMALGGAYSVDKPYRTPHRSWWPQEELTDEDVARACANGPVDVLFTHDSMIEILVPGIHAAWKQDGFAIETAPNRGKVSRVAHQLLPTTLIHGHFHIGYEDTEQIPGLRIIGLNRESEPGSMALIDIADGQTSIERLDVPPGFSDSRMGFSTEVQEASSFLVGAGAV